MQAPLRGGSHDREDPRGFDAVAQGLGAAILSGYAVSEEDKKTFDVFSLDRYFPKRRYGLLLRKKKYFSPAVKAFLRSINPDILFKK